MYIHISYDTFSVLIAFVRSKITVNCQILLQLYWSPASQKTVIWIPGAPTWWYLVQTSIPKAIVSTHSGLLLRKITPVRPPLSCTHWSRYLSPGSIHKSAPEMYKGSRYTAQIFFSPRSRIKRTLFFFCEGDVLELCASAGPLLEISSRQIKKIHVSYNYIILVVFK